MNHDAIFAQAVELIIGKRSIKLRADMNKFEITEALDVAGVSNARDTAQAIISTAHCLLAKK